MSIVSKNGGTGLQLLLQMSCSGAPFLGRRLYLHNLLGALAQ